MRSLIFLAALATTSALQGADISFDPAYWAAHNYINYPSRPSSEVSYFAQHMKGDVAAELKETEVFPYPLAARDELVVDSLYVYGNVDVVWLANYSEASQTITRAVAVARADTREQWSRYDFSDLGLALDSDWFDQPLALLMGAGYTTSFGARSRFGTDYPFGDPQSGFSDGHSFSEIDFNPVGSHLVMKGAPAQPAYMSPTGFMRAAGEVEFSYNYKITPEPSSSCLLILGGLLAAGSRKRRQGLR